jgi:hypothetical protein
MRGLFFIPARPYLKQLAFDSYWKGARAHFNEADHRCGPPVLCRGSRQLRAYASACADTGAAALNRNGLRNNSPVVRI